MKMIFRSLFVIAAVAAVAGAGTYAWYTSTATITGSTFAAGTMDLYVDQNDNGDIQDWVSTFESPVKLENLTPGFSQSQIIDIVNAGGVEGNASIRFHLNSNEDRTIAGAWNGQLAQNMRVKVSYSSDNSNSFTEMYDYTLAEFHNNPNLLLLGGMTGTTFAPTSNIGEGKIASVKLNFYIPANVGNDIQGDSLTVDTIFGLEQTATAPVSIIN